MKRRLLKIAPLLLLTALCILCSCEGHSHLFGSSELIAAPTCEESGIERVECECGEVEERALEPTGHVEKRRVTSEPTCEKDGTFEVECEVCGKLVEAGSIPRKGHELTAYKAVSATCGKVGNEAYESCGVCGYTTYREIPKTAHTPTKAADCVTARTCTVCGEVLEEARGHTVKTVAGRDATCKRAGLSEGRVCSVCGDILVEQIDIPKVCHTPRITAEVAATCLREGTSESVECSVCGEVLISAVEIPLRAHSYGGSLDRECDVCGFLRAVGADACIHREQSTVKKLDSTCDSYGLTQGVTCEDCGEVLVQREVIEPKAHTEKAVRGYSALCGVAGLTEGRACYNCGLVISAGEVVEALGHTVIEDKAVAATCEAGGLTVGKHCAVCAEVIVKQNATLPTGHEMIFHEGKKALCEVGGWNDYYTCESCAYSTYSPLSALGHTEVADESVLATCTASGLGEGRHCSLCGEVTAAQAVIAPTGHNFGKWQSVSSGCSQSETWVRVCKSCFAVESDSSVHSFKAAVKSPECEKGGEVTVFCSACGATAAHESLEALGHDLVWSVTDGGHSKKCYRAGCGYKTDEVDHKSESSASCEDRLCADCGYIMKKGSGHKLSLSYKSDGDSHWRECRNSGCDYREDEKPHENPTALCSDARLRCTVCGSYYASRSNHTLGDWYAATPTSTRRDCTLCGYYEIKFYDE